MKNNDKIQPYLKTPRLGERRTTIQVSIGTHVLIISYARKHNLNVRDAAERLISAGLALEERVL